MKRDHNRQSLYPLLSGVLFATFLSAYTGVMVNAQMAGSAAGGDQHSNPTRVVQQEPGGVVYWVLPGPRRLDPAVFGTAQNPGMLLGPRVQQAQQGPFPPSVPQLFRDLPLLVGLPEQARQPTPDGGQVLRQPNPFSDNARIISGEFEARLFDNTSEDQPLPPGNTQDTAEFTAEFQDPAGNDYRVVLDHIVQPPFPGYETEGGVMIDSRHHGSTGTGSPLMPEVDTQAAFWGIGNIFVNGESVGMHVIHMMTTEVVRNSDYELVFEEDLPLPPGERQIADQEHHTHLMVMPVRGGERGPTFTPVQTAFELPNGQNQPFMHIMFEQDEIIR